jgi:hypothetical protein
MHYELVTIPFPVNRRNNHIYSKQTEISRFEKKYFEWNLMKLLNQTSPSLPISILVIIYFHFKKVIENRPDNKRVNILQRGKRNKAATLLFPDRIWLQRS